MAIRISRTSKLDGIGSWSLQAIDTCPGSIGKDGELVAACKGCYATTGNYHYPNVKEPRIENREDWKREGWVADMVSELDNHRYFRWFDSGDCYDIRMAEKILEVMKQTPWVKHWLPTRMHKFTKFKTVLNRMQSLPNVVVRRSSDSITGKKVAGKNNSTIIPHGDFEIDATICRAYENPKKNCNGCRACWDKDVKTIAYVAHGKKMQKQINLLEI